MIRAALLLALLLPAAASAADRTVGVGSFERLRVEGPFRVTVVAGPPRATVSGGRRAIDQVEVNANGGTLVVRMGANGWGEQPATGGGPVTVTLSTPALASAWLTGGGDVSIARMKGQRVDVSATGAGRVAIASVDADQLTLTVIGSADITATGHAAKARLLTNGSGTIDAGGVAADELVVHLDGTGETKAQARFTAQVVSTGLGRVTVTGKARCNVQAVAGPVSCGPAVGGVAP